MKLLLDTHLLLWAAGSPEKLSDSARSLLLDEQNSLFFSSASIWEIVVKRGLGRDDFRVDPFRLRRLLLANGYAEVFITSDHALAIDRLPSLHKDPFDRVLIAQARTEGMLFVTVDALVTKYGEGTCGWGSACCGRSSGSYCPCVVNIRSSAWLLFSRQLS